MLKVEIDRDTWGRGSEDNWGDMGPQLHAKDCGLYCCLGFVCMAVGLTDEDIGDVDMPQSLSEGLEENIYIQLGVVISDLEWIHASEMNDEGDLFDFDREACITLWGISHEIEFSFIN